MEMDKQTCDHKEDEEKVEECFGCHCSALAFPSKDVLKNDWCVAD